MNEKMVNFAVCRYIPDVLRDEFINVGVLVHVPEDEYVNFYKTKNYRRIKSFDDEVELDVIKVLLESLEYQFNTTTINVPEFPNIGDTNFLNTEIRYYVNQLQFSSIRTFKTNDIQKDVSDLCDTYLYYDKKKTDRIGQDKVRRLVSKMFTNSKLNSIVNRNPEYKNVFHQSPFDFSMKFNNHDTLIKTISFDYKNKNKFFKEVKSLLFDVQYFRDMDINDIKLVINNTELDDEHKKNAYNILNDFMDVYTLEEFSKFIDSTENELLQR